MITNEQASLIVDAFELRDIINNQEEIDLIEPEIILAYAAICHMADEHDRNMQSSCA